MQVMKSGPKPVRRCNRCLLNLGDRCWHYACPRRQWVRKPCPGFGNEELYRRYRLWLEEPRVKTRRQIRQEMFRSAGVARRLHYSNRQDAKR